MVHLTFLLPVLYVKEHGRNHKYSDLPLVLNTSCPGTNKRSSVASSRKTGYSGLEEHFIGKPKNPGLL